MLTLKGLPKFQTSLVQPGRGSVIERTYHPRRAARSKAVGLNAFGALACFLFASLLVSPMLAGDLLEPTQRTWTDSTGKHKIVAVLLTANESRVVLKKETGEQITVPLTKLSLTDRRWLANHLKQQAKVADKDNPAFPQLGEAKTIRLRIGMQFTGRGNSTGVQGIVPVPMSWPEQSVEAGKPDTTPNVRKVSYRNLEDGARQMVILVPKLGDGETARATVDFTITRHGIDGPMETAALVKPQRIDRDLRHYLLPGPLTKSKSPPIIAAAEAAIDPTADAWSQVKAMHAWTIDNIRYQKRDEIKDAETALAEGVGDCQELSSLFVAMCRSRGIPARCVWIPSHSYAEFYLEDATGRGHWYPVESTNKAQFGFLPRTDPILQKGDNFKVPEYREPLHYARTIVKGNSGPGGGSPKFDQIFEHLPVE